MMAFGVIITAYSVIATIIAIKFSVEKRELETSYVDLKEDYEEVKEERNEIKKEYSGIKEEYERIKKEYDEFKYQSLYDDALNDATNTTTLFRGIAFEVLFKWVCSVANNEEFDIEKELGVLAGQHEISISEQKVILLFIQQELEKNFINT